jgi:hypothetical protein
MIPASPTNIEIQPTMVQAIETHIWILPELTSPDAPVALACKKIHTIMTESYQ